ncbi:LytTR family DNA-binding domain-containing protein [Pedobacter sp. P351]|uniref:LytR/AlgR family response regulator transcription factor n=1 Tax=Pedobacter superstes TaxID=3133441 RepID=UPI0030967124
MKCYILDDYTSIKIISKYISNYKELKIVGSSGSTLVAYNEIMTLQPDIVFINSSLPKLNLDKLDFVTAFIYTADAPHFAAEAFENNAVDYLMKPFTLERFSKCIEKVIQKKVEANAEILKDKSRGNDYFFVKNESRGNKVIRIKYDDIIYIEASQNYVNIHLTNKSHLIYLTMKELEDFLPSDKFVRVHKSYLINEQKITSIDGNKICLEDMYTILYSGSYKKGLLSKVHPKLITSKRRFDKPLNDLPDEGLGLNID